MYKTLAIFSKIIFFISVICLPFLGVGFFFGIVGFAPQFLVLAAMGYIGIMLFSFFSIKEPEHFPMIFASSVFIVFGIGLNESYWSVRSDRACQQLRRNPTCQENVCTFYCTNLYGKGKTILGNVCRDKDMNACKDILKTGSTETQQSASTSTN